MYKIWKAHRSSILFEGEIEVHKGAPHDDKCASVPHRPHRTVSAYFIRKLQALQGKTCPVRVDDEARGGGIRRSEGLSDDDGVFLSRNRGLGRRDRYFLARS